MSARLRPGLGTVLAGTMFLLVVGVTTAPAQINTGIIEKHRAELEKQATDPALKRERGTQPQDWLFVLPEGVSSRQVKTDDRLRFSQMTARVRIRRKRLIPQQQILDVRNALYYLQGEPGVDRARVSVWGTGMAGGHAH